MNSKLITSMLGITLTTSAMAVVPEIADENVVLTKQELVEIISDVASKTEDQKDIEILVLEELQARGVLIIDTSKSSIVCGG